VPFQYALLELADVPLDRECKLRAPPRKFYVQLRFQPVNPVADVHDPLIHAMCLFKQRRRGIGTE
jgi:hypothetical protein